MKKEYLKTNKANTYILVEVRYNKGGTNLFTYKNESRGYYISASPIERENKGGYFLESYMGFSGYKSLYKEVSRASKKAEAEADAAMMEFAKPMIEQILQEQGLELAENIKEAV